MAVEALSLSAQAALYNSLSDMQFKDASLLIEEILKPQLGESILDLGCGTGRAAMVLASRVGPSGRILGVDPNSSRVDVAQQTLQLATSEVEHVSFMNGTCADAFVKGTFDAIFSNYVLHWIQDHISVLQDAYKCLRSGGRFVFLTSADAPPIVKMMFMALIGSKEVAPIVKHKYGNAEYWSKTCTEAGFTVDFIEEKDSLHTLPDAMSFMHFLKATIPSDVITLPNPQKEDVVEWMKPFTDENSGHINFGMPIVRAVVRKV
jgi:ubiquinone/menaquinone biosynthesis C-methylase UbiE